MYNTQGYWIIGLCPSSRMILRKRKRMQRFGNWIRFLPNVRPGETPTLLGPL
jgi:hypothetical protein